MAATRPASAAAQGEGPPLLITGLASTLYRIPPATPWEDATHRVSGLEFLLLDLETDEGITGTGFTYTVGVGGSAVKALLDDYCRPLLLGADLRDPERLWQTLRNHLHRTGSGGINTLALAAVDIAAWDAVARSQDQPLYRVLGGARDSIPAYGSGIDLFMSPAQLRDHLLGYTGQGYTAVKIKVGCPTLQEDVRRVAAAREVIGPDGILLLDANQSWRLDEAVRRVAAFEPWQPFWIEEPLAPEDIEGHARLRQACRVPVAAGESLYSKHQFLEYLRAGAVDILQPDAARVGGITEWLKIAHLAESWNRPVAPHFLMELSVSLLCAVPNGLILENVTGGSLTELGVLEQPIAVRGGRAEPPTGPGHGIGFGRRRLAPYAVSSAQLQELDPRTHK